MVNNVQFHMAGACWRTYCIPSRCAFDLEGNTSIDLHSQTTNAGHRSDLYPATQIAGSGNRRFDNGTFLR